MKPSHTTAAMAATMTFLLTSVAGAQDEKTAYTHISDVVIFDGVNERTTEGSVLIEDNLIKEVGANVKAPEGATVIDGGGRFLMPGLIDAHTHLMVTGPTDDVFGWQPEYIALRSGAEAKAQLMRGFTTVRDMGGPLQSLKRAVDEGVIPGPRI